MKFALLNADDATADFVEALARAGHEVIGYYGGDATAAARIQTFAPQAKPLDAWEGVLVESGTAVIAGTAGGREERFEQLRRLALEGMPAVVIHPAGLSTLEYHEVDMNRQAGRAPLVAYEPKRHHPLIATAARELHASSDESGIGPVQQIIIDRQSGRRGRDDVLREFVGDLGSAQQFVGPCQKISAMGSLTHDRSTNDLGVQVTTSDCVLIRWSIGPVLDRAGAVMTIVGGRGRCTVAMPEQGDWTIEFRIGDETARDVEQAGAASQHSAAAVVAAIEAGDESPWRGALADMELVDALERSLHKGRTIELFHEAASEEGTFKGVMAAGGCLMLMLGIAAAVAATIFGSFRLPGAGIWPYALLALMSVFLLLQLLRFAFPPEPRK